MSTITYLKGDATNPIDTNNKTTMISHICNDKGYWGKGFVLAITKKWPQAEVEYRRWESQRHDDDSHSSFKLGEIQSVKVDTNVFVTNMIAQHGVAWIKNYPPVRYDRVRQCLNKVAALALKLDASVHMPDLIGCGLAGGHRKTMIGIIEETLLKNNIDVFIYKLKQG